MNPALIDVSVLLIFFNRPDLFSQVFEQVKKARPARLFLYQDGPRTDNDMEGIEKCREIVSDIEWECEVHTKFQNKNYGCDPSGYLADKLAFSITDKCIILEDDCVPSVSFFKFCKEMLDKYEHNPRIWMISGFNHEEISVNVDSDYFFTEFMSIWGWATWRRVIDRWDSQYDFLNNKDQIEKVSRLIDERKLRKDFIQFCKDHKSSGKEHFETILWSSMILNNGLSIMPVKNMINNVGATTNSTHFNSGIKTMPRNYRKIFTMPSYELTFPIKHTDKIEPNERHREEVYKILAWNHPLIKVGRSFEELWLNLKYGNFKNIKKSLRNRAKLCIKTLKG